MKELQYILNNYLLNKGKQKKYLAFVLALSMLVSFAVPLSLIQPADSMTIQTSPLADRLAGAGFTEVAKDVPNGAVDFEPKITAVGVEWYIENSDSKTGAFTVKYAFGANSGVGYEVEVQDGETVKKIYQPYIYMQLPENMVIIEDIFDTNNAVDDETDGWDAYFSKWLGEDIEGADGTAGYYSINTDGLIVIRFTDLYLKYLDSRGGKFQGSLKFDGQVNRADNANGDQVLDFGDEEVDVKVEFPDKNPEVTKTSNLTYKQNGWTRTPVVTWTVTITNPNKYTDLTGYQLVDSKFDGATLTTDPANVGTLSDNIFTFNSTANKSETITLTYVNEIDQRELETANGNFDNTATLYQPDGTTKVDDATANQYINPDTRKATVNKSGKPSYQVDGSLDTVEWTIEVSNAFGLTVMNFGSWDPYVIKDEALKKATEVKVYNEEGRELGSTDGVTVDLANGTVSINNWQLSTAKIVYRTPFTDATGTATNEVSVHPSNLNNTPDDSDNDNDVYYDETDLFTVQKNDGQWDENLQAIKWTATVKVGYTNQNSVDTLEGYKISDTLASQITGDVKVIAAQKDYVGVNDLSNISITKNGDSYIIHGDVDQVSFEYYTKLTDVQKAERLNGNLTIENSMTVTPPDANDVTENDSGSVTINQVSNSFNKTITSNSYESEEGKFDEDKPSTQQTKTIDWQLDLRQYTGFKDKLLVDVMTASDGDEHSMLPSQGGSGIVVKAKTANGNFETLKEGTDYTIKYYSDKEHTQEITNFTSQSTSAKSFEIIFKDTIDQKNYIDVKVNYSTTADVTNVEKGTTGTFSNTAQFNGEPSSNAPEYTFERTNPSVAKINVGMTKDWVNDNASLRPGSILVQLERRNNDTQHWDAYGEVQTVSASDNWYHQWTDLPQHDSTDAKNPYYYRVVEVVLVNGEYVPATKDNTNYDVTYDNTNGITQTGNLTITNTWQYMGLTVNKDWQQDLYDYRPTATIEIWKRVNGVETLVETIPLEKPNTSITRPMLPKYDADGNEIYYFVKEVIPEDGSFAYDVSYSNNNGINDTGTITVTNTWKNMNVAAQKNWVSDDASKRPASVTLVLMKRLEGETNWTQVEGVEEKVITKNESGSFTNAVWNNLPQTESGKKVYYRVVEKNTETGEIYADGAVTSDGYQVSYDATGKNGAGTQTVQLTNTWTKMDVVGNKIWNDNNATSKRTGPITFVLMQKTETGWEPVEGQAKITRNVVNGQLDGEIRWNDLPVKDSNGNPIYYRVEEENVPDGYVASYDENGVNGIGTQTVQLTNTWTLTNVTANKIWKNDTPNKDRPDSITFVLKQKIENVDSDWVSAGKDPITLQIDDNGNIQGTATWENLPTMNGNNKIYYRVEEVDIKAGYVPEYSEQGVHGVGEKYATVINTWTNIDVTGQKNWKDDYGKESQRPAITLVLEQRLDGTDSWAPVKDAEKKPLTNDGHGNFGTAVWNNLPKTDTDTGKAIYYRVVEETIPAGYEATYDNTGINSTGTVYLTNTYVKIKVAVRKQWVDTGSQDILVQLQQKEGENGEWTNYGTPQTVSGSNNYYEWTDLMPYNDDKTPYYYRVVEVVQVQNDDGTTSYDPATSENTDYVVTYSSNNENGINTSGELTITNTWENMNLTVYKQWQGDSGYESERPNKIEVKLQQKIGENGEWTDVNTEHKYIQTESWAQNNNAYTSVTWENLPKTDEKSGESIYYRGVEVACYRDEALVDDENYTASSDVNGKNETGSVNITNTYNYLKLTANKNWAGENNNTSYRPGTITFILERRTGAQDWTAVTDQNRVLTEDNQYAAVTWEKLPIADPAGNLYDYRVVEAPVENYKSSDPDPNGTNVNSSVRQFTITNTLIPPYSKSPVMPIANVCTDTNSGKVTVTNTPIAGNRITPSQLEDWEVQTVTIDGTATECYIFKWKVDLSGSHDYKFHDILPTNSVLYEVDGYRTTLTWAAGDSNEYGRTGSWRAKIHEYPHSCNDCTEYTNCVYFDLSGQYTPVSFTYCTAIPKSIVDNAIESNGTYSITNQIKSDDDSEYKSSTLQIQKAPGTLDDGLIDKGYIGLESDGRKGIVRYSLIVNPDGKTLSSDGMLDITDIFEIIGYKEGVLDDRTTEWNNQNQIYYTYWENKITFKTGVESYKAGSQVVLELYGIAGESVFPDNYVAPEGIKLELLDAKGKVIQAADKMVYDSEGKATLRVTTVTEQTSEFNITIANRDTNNNNLTLISAGLAKDPVYASGLVDAELNDILIQKLDVNGNVIENGELLPSQYSYLNETKEEVDVNVNHYEDDYRSALSCYYQGDYTFGWDGFKFSEGLELVVEVEGNPGASVSPTVRNNPSGITVTPTDSVYDSSGKAELKVYFEKEYTGQFLIDTENTSSKHFELISATVTTHEYFTKNHLNISIPDETPLKITYSYKLKTNEKTPSVLSDRVEIGQKPPQGDTIITNNEASLKTNNGTATDGESDLKFEILTSTGFVQSVESPKIQKVNVANYSINDLVAVFKIAKYDSEIEKWVYATGIEDVLDEGEVVSHILTYGAEEAGTLIPAKAVDLEVTGSFTVTFEDGVLYKLIETQSPNGYVQTDWVSADETTLAMMDAFTTYFVYNGDATNLPDGLTAQDVQVLEVNKSLTIPNYELIDIGANKTWSTVPTEAASVNLELWWSYTKSSSIPAEPLAKKVTAEDLGLASDFNAEYTLTSTSDANGNPVWNNPKIWKDLPNGKDGKPIYYYVKEVSYTIGDQTYLINADGSSTGDFKPTYSNNAVNKDAAGAGTVSIMNTEGMIVEKLWRNSDGTVKETGIPVSEIQFNLYGVNNGVMTTNPIYSGTLKKDEGWRMKIPSTVELTNYDSYRIEEVLTDAQKVKLYGYVVSDIYNINGASGVITLVNKDNSPTECEVTVEKVWGDGNDRHAEDSIEVKLYRSEGEWTNNSVPPDGSVVYDPSATVSGTQILNAANGWTYKWEKLPYKGDNGPYYYYVVETEVPENYVASYRVSGSENREITITNDIPGGLAINKTWFTDSGIEIEGTNANLPASIDVEIYRKKYDKNTGSAAVPSELTDLKVVSLGDSITQGTYNGFPETDRYWYKLEGLLQDRGYTNAYVDEKGVDRDEINNVISRVDRTATYCDSSKLVDLTGVDVVCLLIGTNDVMHGLSSGSTGRFTTLIDTIYTEAKKVGNEDIVILVGSIPYITKLDWFKYPDNDPTQDRADELVDNYNEAISGVVTEYANAGKKIAFVSEINETVTKDKLEDGCHPDPSGYTALATAFYNAINSYYKVSASTNTSAWEPINGIPTDLTTNTDYEKVTSGEGFNADGTVTLYKAEDWTKILSTLDKSDGTKDYIYFVKEVEKDGFTTGYLTNGQIIKENGTSTITITNTKTTPKLNFTVKKTWLGNSDASTPALTLKVMQSTDGINWTHYEAAVTPTPDQDGIYTYENLPAEDLDGKKYYYKVVEVVPEGYRLLKEENNNISSDSTDKQIKLTNVKTFKLNVVKQWADGDTHAEKTITIKLCRSTSKNGNENTPLILNVEPTTLQLGKGGSQKLVSNRDDVIYTTNSELITVAPDGTITAGETPTGNTPAIVVAKAGGETVEIEVHVVDTLTVNPNSCTVVADKSAELTATLPATIKTWNSNIANITISEDGKTITVVGVAAGEADLVVTDGETDFTVKITVLPVLAIDPVGELVAGDTLQLGTNRTGEIGWTVISGDAVTVDTSGNLTAVKSGTATIQAQLGDETATLDITVNPFQITNGEAASINIGGELQLEANRTNGVTWTSNSEKILVDENSGKVTLSADAAADDTATITATYNGKTDTIEVTVAETVTSLSGTTSFSGGSYFDIDTTGKTIQSIQISGLPTTAWDEVHVLIQSGDDTVHAKAFLNGSWSVEKTSSSSWQDKDKPINSYDGYTLKIESGKMIITFDEGFAADKVQIATYGQGQSGNAGSFNVSYNIDFVGSSSGGNGSGETEEPTTPTQVEATLAKNGKYYDLTFSQAMGDTIYLDILVGNGITYVKGRVGMNVTYNGVTKWTQFSWEYNGTSPVAVSLTNPTVSDVTDQAMIAGYAAEAQKMTATNLEFWWATNDADVSNENIVKLNKAYIIPATSETGYSLRSTLNATSAASGLLAAATGDTADVEFNDAGEAYITLNGSDIGWEMLIENLDACDESGNEYYYWIEEVSIKSGTSAELTPSQAGFSPSYRFEDGEDTYSDINDKYIDAAAGNATATVKNTRVETGGTSMPSTGGTGTQWYYLIGMMTMLMGTAGFIGLKLRQRSQG